MIFLSFQAAWNSICQRHKTTYSHQWALPALSDCMAAEPATFPRFERSQAFLALDFTKTKAPGHFIYWSITRTRLSYLSFCNHRLELNCRACPVYFLVEIRSKIYFTARKWASTKAVMVTQKNSTTPKIREAKQNELQTGNELKSLFFSRDRLGHANEFKSIKTMKLRWLVKWCFFHYCCWR